MKLYFAKGACSLAVRITINELGIKCDFESVDIHKTKKTETGKDFLKVNPKAYVPVLELDDGKILTENVAIQIYLAENFDGEKLLPKAPNFTRYQVIEWLSYITTELHKTAGALFNHAMPQELKDTLFVPMLKKKLKFVDEYLKNKDFLVDRFTVADAYLFVVLSWIPYFKIDLSEWNNVNRYYMNLHKRPSVQKALQAENLLKTEKGTA